MTPQESIDQAEWMAQMIVDMTPVFARCHSWPIVTAYDWEPVEQNLGRIAADLANARHNPDLEARCLVIEQSLARGDVQVMCQSLKAISRCEVMWQ